MFWFLNSRLVFLGDPNLEVTNRGQILRIKSARLGDKARYQCSVLNTAGKESKDFNLSVHGECTRLRLVSPLADIRIIFPRLQSRPPSKEGTPPQMSQPCWTQW